MNLVFDHCGELGNNYKLELDFEIEMEMQSQLCRFNCR